ncbi:hypothetical protein [Candidatus Tisiphia endosymbiont of Beris chalybata]|uniref:hypothetical protein n=1 Tax=Candidatus Tisiphia endosymbiont of Beris chalybata TaxID=3066262 RepID=UPI00312C7060
MTQGVLRIDCSIKKNITEILSKIGEYPCKLERGHFNLDYWLLDCRFSPKEFKLVLDNIYQHLVVKCGDKIVEWLKSKPLTAYIDLSNEGEKIEGVQIKEATKFLCKVMKNLTRVVDFNQALHKSLKIIIELGDNITNVDETITLIEDSPAIIVQEVNEGHGDFHSLAIHSGLIRNNSCMIQEGDMMRPEYKPHAVVALQIVLAVGGIAASVAILGAIGKFCKDAWCKKYQNSPPSSENTSSSLELTVLNRPETENCEVVSMAGEVNLALTVNAE